MESLLPLIAPIVAVGGLYVVAPVIAEAYRRFRGPKTVVCPENNKTAEIELDAAGAAVSAAFGEPVLEVTRCSRWPERHYCNHGCLQQLK